VVSPIVSPGEAERQKESNRMGKSAKQSKRNQNRAQKIQGVIGTRSGEISTLCVSVKPRNYIAIERFKRGTGADGKPDYIYVETPYDPDQTKGLDRLKAWLDRERRYIGQYSTLERYSSGLRNITTGGKGAPQARTASQLHQYSSEICGDMHRKPFETVGKNKRRAEGAERDFLRAITRP
jgi:hypothetical protein